MITLEQRIRLQQYGIGLLRLVVGTILMAHGAQKVFEFGLSGTAGAFAQFGIPLPTASAAVVMTVELLGGLALALGFLTRLAAVPLAVTMLVAMLAVTFRRGSSCRTGSSSRWPSWPAPWP